jgi:hypothetical protein
LRDRVAQCAAFFGKTREPVEAKSVFYSGTAPRAKLPASIRSSLNLSFRGS